MVNKAYQNYRDDLTAAMAQNEALRRKEEKIDTSRAGAKESLTLLHLRNIAAPPYTVLFDKVDHFGDAVLLVTADDSGLALAYQIGWFRVRVACVGRAGPFRADHWVLRPNTKTCFWGQAAKRLKMALRTLHVRTRMKEGEDWR